MDAPPLIVLVWVLAVVIGYFAGRTLGILDQTRSDRD
jgi:hypothetical protein